MPIIKSLATHHKIASGLIVAEIALTCAIVCNAVFLVGERLERIERPSGVAESEIVRLQIAGLGTDANARSLTRADVAALREISGVSSVTVTNQIPYGGSSWNSGVSLSAEQTHATINATTYLGDDDFVETMGLRLVAGRDFEPGEYLDFDPEKGFISITKVDNALITRALAELLFPGKSGVGEVFYFVEEPVRVVGVVERLVRPRPIAEDPTGKYTVILPVRLTYASGGRYVIRTSPGERARVLGAAAEVLERNDPNRVVLDRQTFEEVRADYFRKDRAMAWLLVTVCVALLVVTALGIVGLASFWVQQRTHQIGVRRALGATRAQILRYFQLENLLLTTAGIIAGMAMAYGINMWLMERYALARLPAMVLPIGAVTLWALGQLAVLGPAVRAAAVPPAVATRTI